MAKKRRTKQQKIKAQQRREKTYSRTPQPVNSDIETPEKVVKEATKSQPLTEHKSLLLSLVLFATLLLVQLTVWMIWG